jgi:hypothetical protein
VKLSKKALNFGIKMFIAALLAWAIYRQVFAHENMQGLWLAFLQHFNYPNIGWLLVVVLLVPVNLTMETLKWRQLIRSFSHLGFWKIFQAILAGTTIAMFTPNRIGEYGGRVLFIEKGKGWEAVIATIVGSLSQMLVLLSVGLLGTLYFSSKFFEPEPYIIPVSLSLGISFIVFLFFTYFNIDLVVPLAKRVPHIHKFRKWLRHLVVLRHYHSRDLRRTLLYSFLRYLVYSIQYYLLLQFYGVPVSWVMGMAGIATIYFVQASVPLPPVMALFARGEIALYVWGFFTQDKVDILAATFSLFVINIAVPALLGLLCIVQLNILKSIGYENGDTK